MKLFSRLKSERGNVMALVMGGVALSAVLGVTTFSLMSGPLKSITSVNRDAVAHSHVQAITRIALMDAQNQSSYGDCDGDSYVELRDPRDAGGSATSPIEFVPLSLGAPTRDPWGNDYLYCTWDIGTVFEDAGCGGAPALRANGTDDPSTGSAISQTFVAAFSAGPNGTINSTCADYTNGTTAVFTCGGDDICQSYTYDEAAKTVNGVWSLKDGSPSTITTSKDIEIGADITIDSASGDATFTTLSSTGKMIASGGLKVGLDDTISYCDVDHTGKLRYNNDDEAIEVCDGADWIALGAGASADPPASDVSSYWQETAASSGHIYYDTGSVMVGTQTPTSSDLLKLVTEDSRDIELFSNSATAGERSSFDLYHAGGSAGSPSSLSAGDNIGYINFKGYGTAGTAGFKTGASITQELTGAAATSLIFAVGDSGGTLTDALSFNARGGLNAGTTQTNAMVGASGTNTNILVDTFNTGAANGSSVLMRRSRGTSASPSAISSGDMLGAITFSGEDGNGVSSASAINFIANGTINTTKLNTDLVIQASPSGNASATAINAEALRFRSLNSTGQYGGINNSNPTDALNVNGTVRISQSGYAEGNNHVGCEFSWGGECENQFQFLPRDGSLRAGRDNGNFFYAWAPSFSSLSLGAVCSAEAANSICIDTDDSGMDIGTWVGPPAINTITFAGYQSLPLNSPNSVVGLAIKDNFLYGEFLTAGSIMGTDAWWGTLYPVTVGMDAHHVTLPLVLETTVYSPYVYAFGQKMVISGDHIFAVNLDDVAMEASQPNTMVIMNGNVGVGTKTPSYRTHVVGTAGLSTSATGNWTVYSDARLKNVYGPYEKTMRDIAQLQPIRFNYKKDNPYGYTDDYELTGFIAQAVQTVFPEAVSINEETQYLDFDMHSINIAKINAIKDLHKTQAALMAEQKEILEEHDALMKKYADLRTRTDRLMNAAGIPTRLAFLDNVKLGYALPLLFVMAFGAGLWRSRKDNA